MEFTNLKVDDYPSFLKLYNSTFPENERRVYADESQLADFIRTKRDKFHVFCVKDGDAFIGFLSYWTFEGYTYVEHFAVISECRGNNIGTKMLQHLFQTSSRNVLLEVEPPMTLEARNRIRFYEKNGFSIRTEFIYTQPPYSPRQQPVEMLIMTHGDVKLHDLGSMRELLHEVYNVNCP